MKTVTGKGQVACVEGQKEMKPDKIYIQMLGNFSMVYQGKQIQLGKWLSAKMIHLLLLLICSREDGVSREELIRRRMMPVKRTVRQAIPCVP